MERALKTDQSLALTVALIRERIEGAERDLQSTRQVDLLLMRETSEQAVQAALEKPQQKFLDLAAS